MYNNKKEVIMFIKSRKSQSGSIKSYVIIGIVLAVALIGSVYYLNNRGEQARKEEKISYTGDQKKNTEPTKQQTNTTKNTTDTTKNESNSTNKDIVAQNNTNNTEAANVNNS